MHSPTHTRTAPVRSRRPSSHPLRRMRSPRGSDDATRLPRNIAIIGTNFPAISTTIIWPSCAF